jgi:hypothetical protein
MRYRLRQGAMGASRGCRRTIFFFGSIVLSESYSKADLHLHTSYSDGGYNVATVLEHVATCTDLRIIAITDHDCLTGALEAQHLAPRYGLQIVVGEEVSTRRGHLLALFIKSLIPAGLSIPETVAAVHEQGGLAVLAHPFDRVCNSPMRHWPRPTPQEWAAFGLDGLEAHNGCQLDARANPRAEALGHTLGLALTGGSDAHHLAVIGLTHTLFPGHTLAELRCAIEHKTCLPAGRRWNRREYLGWVAHSFAPRTLRALVRPPQLHPELALYSQL